MAGWMNMRKHVAGVLAPLEAAGIPVCFTKWAPLNDDDQLPASYLTYFEMLRQDELMTDDDEDQRGRYMQIDIWSVEPTEDIAQRVRDLMKAAHFLMRDDMDIPEDGTGTYHSMSRWLYIEEVR